MSGYQAITDAFYAEHADAWVLVSWNGIPPGGHGRQSCSFITPRKDAFDRYRLASIWPDDALRFPSREAAEQVLDEERSARAIGDSWTPARLGELDRHTTYFPQAKAALIGGPTLGADHEETPAAAAAP